jgi:hypothetical protein
LLRRHIKRRAPILKRRRKQQTPSFIPFNIHGILSL